MDIPEGGGDYPRIFSGIVDIEQSSLVIPRGITG